MDRLKRFRERQRRKKYIQPQKLYLVPNEELINKHLNSSVDHNLINDIENTFKSVYDFEFNINVFDEEVKRLLDILEKQFNEQKFNALLNECKYSVLQSIVIPFGLGGLVAKFDKEGGNVDTIHNVRKGIYVTEEEKQRYRNRGEYNSYEYHSDNKYIEKNRIDSQKQKNGQLEDAYTGKKLTPNSKRDLDHTISAKEIHDDPGRILAEIDGVKLANADSNLNSTERIINRAKGAKTVEEFLDWLKRTENQRKRRIRELEQKDTLTETERKELNKLKILDSIDPQKFKEKYEKASGEYNRTVSKGYYASSKFIKNTVTTSTKEGLKMGMQQSIGLLLFEFFSATFNEISYIYKNGYPINDLSFIETLKYRLKRIADRIASRWKDVCTVFSQSFISGFLSNLATVVINAFITTGKRMVRIIREGFFSLLRAIRLICFPPEEMTRVQAVHEASKLIASGFVIIVGIAIEQYIDSLIKGTVILEPISDIITSVLMGAITGIAVTFIVYAIDQIDFFKVNAKEKYEVIIRELDSKLNCVFSNAEQLIEEIAW